MHVGVAALVVLMVNLGFWQLRRLDEKRTFNTLVTSRSVQPVTELSRIDAPVDPSATEWRRISVPGEYDWAHELRVVNRSQSGMAGYDQVVPLRTGKFGWVIVNRGFVPLSADVKTSRPTGPVTVVGYLRASQKRGALGAVDSTDPANKDFQRFDLPLMTKSLSGGAFPMFVQMFKESPWTESAWPVPVAFPELTEGPHQSYAVQWFFFSTVAVAAWAVVVRRKWRGTVSPPTPG